MKQSLKRIDASLLCFALVVVAAIPVAALRSKTYSIGYELGRLKSEEKILRQKNGELQSQLAAVQRSIRDQRVTNNPTGKSEQLNLPSKSNVLRSNEKHMVTETAPGAEHTQNP